MVLVVGWGICVGTQMKTTSCFDCKLFFISHLSPYPLEPKVFQYFAGKTKVAEAPWPSNSAVTIFLRFCFSSPADPLVFRFISSIVFRRLLFKIDSLDNTKIEFGPQIQAQKFYIVVGAEGYGECCGSELADRSRYKQLDERLK